MSSFFLIFRKFILQGYRKLIENAAYTKEQLNSAGAIESDPRVYNELKIAHDHF